MHKKTTVVRVEELYADIWCKPTVYLRQWREKMNAQKLSKWWLWPLLLLICRDSFAQSLLDEIKNNLNNLGTQLKKPLQQTQKADQSAPVTHAGTTTSSPSNRNNSRTTENQSVGITPVPAGYVIPTWADRLDVVGVKVGMPAAQALQALKTNNPRFDIKTEIVQFANIDTPSAWVVVAKEVGPPSSSFLLMEEVDFRLSLPPQPSVVTEAVRMVRFPQGEEPTVASVIKSLQSKYGNNFVRINRDPTFYVWRLDGQRVEQPGTQRGCYYDLAPISPVRRLGEQASGISYLSDLEQELREVQGRISTANLCGVVVTAKIGLLTNEQLVGSLLVRVSSEPFRLSTSQKTVAYLHELERARKNKEATEHKGVDVKM